MKKQKIISVILAALGVIIAVIAIFQPYLQLDSTLVNSMAVIASILFVGGLGLYNLEIKIDKETKRKLLTVLSLILITIGVIGALVIIFLSKPLQIIIGITSLFFCLIGVILLFNINHLVK